jgi:hypothetical protein
VKVDFAFLEAGGEPAEVLEFAKAALDSVPLFVQRSIVGPGRFAVGSGRDHRDGSGRFDVLDNRIRIVPFVGQHRLRFSLAQQCQCLCAVRHLSGGDHEVHRLAQLMAQQVNLGR